MTFRTFKSKLAAPVLAAVLGGAALGGCTTVAQETRISTPLSASEYNDIAARYMERPTFATVQAMTDGQEVLRLEMDTYGRNVDPTTGIEKPYTMVFDKRFVGEYLTLIDKYLEWEKLALERSDLIEKDLGSASTWSGLGGTGRLDFSFYSASASNHVLTIEYCAVGTCINPFNFTHPNVVELRKLLENFSAGRVGQADVDGIYN